MSKNHSKFQSQKLMPEEKTLVTKFSLKNIKIVFLTFQNKCTGWARKDAPLKNFYNSKTIWDSI